MARENGIPYKEYHFLLDGDSSLNHGFHISTRSALQAPKPRYYEFDEVIARNGMLRKPMNTFDEVTIEFECNFACSGYEVNNRWRSIKQWLLGNTSKRKLTTSDDFEWFRYVSKIELSELKRGDLETTGEFTVTMTLDPFDYAISGQKWTNIEDIKYNPYYQCEPVYKVTLVYDKDKKITSSDFLIVVNDKSFKINYVYASSPVYIDTGLCVTYRYIDEGLGKVGHSGQESDLVLKNAMNTISYSTSNKNATFKVEVMPRWRSI